jgi:AcrR family transcriptional regulator
MRECSHNNRANTQVIGAIMDKKPPTSRKERRASVIRRQIIEAAANLFAEQGFHRTTTKDIALAADVSEGTIYNYFDNKDDLLIGIMEHLYEAEHLDAQLINSLPTAPDEFLFQILEKHKINVAQNNAMMQAVLSEILVNPKLRQRYYLQIVSPQIQQLTDHVLSRIESGQIKGYKPQHLVRILISLTFGLYLLQVLKDDVVSSDWEALSQSVAQVLFEGIKPE